ncbi:MAG: MMPL family transporter [Spirochaetales bacterium]|uniref:MMPL family transporter n=1 Tax=Candidatus Thalassospirochaeta sargassi TaxID=3119039 RepID=A0AAJ1IDB3_9SPIO|nr:MMPL family transporter [Spirochaetales bacterium]
MSEIKNKPEKPKSSEALQNWFAALAAFVIRIRVVVVILFAALMAFSIFGIMQLRTTTSIDSFFLQDDPLVAKRDQFESIFQNNDFIGILVEADDVFAPEVIQTMHDLNNEIIERVPYVSSITSIPTTVPALLGGASFHFENDILTDDEAALEDLRSRFDKRRSMRSVLYSKDYKQAWILVNLQEYPQVWESNEEPPMYTGHKMMEIIEEFQNDNIDITPTGVPVLAFRKAKEMMEDLTRVILIAGIAALICIIFLIRTPMGVAGSMIIMAGSILTVFGALGGLGITADTTFMLVPMLLTIAITVGYTVHVTNFFKRHLKKTENRKEAVIMAFRETGWPILFTAFTTIIALISFVFVPIFPIRWVGIVSSISIFCVYIYIMIFYCALLSFGPKEYTARDEKRNRDNDAAFEKIGNFFVRNGKIFVPLSAVILIILSLGMLRLDVNLNTNKMMGTKLPHSRDQIYISRTEIGVIMSYDIALVFEDKNQVLTSETLGKLDELSDFIKEYTLIKDTRGINESLKEFNLIRFMDAEGQYRLPQSDAGIRGLVNFYSRIEGNDLDSWLSEDHTSLRLNVKVIEMSSSELADHIVKVENEIGRIFSEDEYPGIKVLVTGGVVQMATMNQYVTKGLVQSVGAALIAIIVILMLAFRSFKLGLIGIIPNIAPVIAAGGLMGYLNVPLEFVTMTVAPMLLGLSVDNTIHLITHIETVYNRTGSYDIALPETFRAVGKSVIQTTIILCITFFIFSFSRVQSMVNMGLLTMVGIIAALAADLIITPVLIKWTKPFKEISE